MRDTGANSTGYGHATSTHPALSATQSNYSTKAADPSSSSHLTSSSVPLATGSSHLNSGSSSHLFSSSSSHLASSHLPSTSSSTSTDNAMTRSEEHLLVGKERVKAGKAELNKYVTTEKVSTTVPLVKEHAVVEREPITDANRSAAMRGADFKEAHYEVNLSEERAVTQKQAVPVERVRLKKEEEQTQQYVAADLRKEHIEVQDGARQGSGATAATASKTLANSVTGPTTQQAAVGRQ